MNKQTEALKILKQHNEWRRGADIEMQNPVLVGEAIDVAIEMLEQPAQEPVAWYGTGDMHIWKRNLEDNEDATLKVTNRPKAHNGNWIPLYTHPCVLTHSAPSCTTTKEWVGLSDDEIDKMWEFYNGGWYDFAMAIEQALKEKNT